ncbi:MAG TPA: neutral zinc metallopeptidase [Acidimicrobiales bacterium]|nr:neutral zinc metallopeptidase [Acidimicrobiales bacterium]
MRTNRFRVAAVAVALAVAVAACGGGDDDGGAAGVAQESTTTSTEPPQDGQMETSVPEIEEPIEPMGDPSQVDTDTTESADQVMIAAALDVEEFWRSTYPEVYEEDYEEIAGGFWTYGPDTEGADLPPCPGVTAYEDIAVNAFYCSDGDLIAWDREGLVEPFIEEFGAFTAAVVMAHEFGHAIQARTGDFDTLRSVISELQADCFAGAWVAHVIDGESEAFQADLDDLDVAIAGLIEIRDAPGSSPDDPQAHGSGFDRVSAFSDGIDEGAARCAGYGTEEPVVVQQVFDTQEESSMGDLPAEELLPLLVGDLEDYYAGLFEQLGSPWEEISDVQIVDPARDEVECGGDVLAPEDIEFGVYYCVDENTVVLDGVELVPALEEIGDFALGAELARQWSFAAQVQQGNTDNSKESLLNADCLTGLYAGDVFFKLRPDSELSLSAGDLDEAIISFLAFGGDAESGSPFERTEAFRTGFLGGFDDCEALLA